MAKRTEPMQYTKLDEVYDAAVEKAVTEIKAHREKIKELRRAIRALRNLKATKFELPSEVKL